MYLTSLVIDGFKSYGKRVELNGFDPEFNAITGFNGTGKSNILDAICFALGISSIKTIRASTMQDVIYKSGQAGILTATVSLTFDNRDKLRSAPQYKHIDKIIISREVEIGSNNIYRISGVIVPAKKIADFFNSLQMNVNNPHFIIMQGRITKVLNMKPREILSMVEEAAGTKMYESKKRSLEMAFYGKDIKLKKMVDDVYEEIIPTINTIAKEKQMLVELNMVHSELNKQKKKLESWNYVKFIEKVRVLSEELQIIIDVKQDKKNIISRTMEQIKFMKAQLYECSQTILKTDNVKLNKLKDEMDKIEKEKNDLYRTVESCKADITSELEKIKDLEKQLNNSIADFKAKETELENFNEIYAFLDGESKKNKIILDKIENKIRLLNSGNIFVDEVDGSVQENIRKLKFELQNQKSENQLYDIKIDGFKNKLNQLLTGTNETQKIYDLQMTQLKIKENEYKQVNNEYLKVNEELDQYDNLNSNLNRLQQEIRDLNLTKESFEYYNPGLFFRFNDPRPNFDRRKIHGLLCRLFQPIDFKFELALTTLAGGKLYYIVVEDDTIGKDILETNKFPNRMNFIPLNKIKSDSLPPNIIYSAQQVGGADNVFPAMSLIKYDKKHIKAIQWVFGQAFICNSAQIAEKVCFDERVRRTCYTLSGDYFSPNGSVTGGTNNQKLILKNIAEQDDIASRLHAKKSELAQVTSKLGTIGNLPDVVVQLRDQLLTVQEELEKIKSDVHLGLAHQQVIEVNNIKQQIDNLDKKLIEGKVNEKQLVVKIKILEEKMKNAGNILKQQLSDAEKNRNLIKSKNDSNKAEYNEQKNIFEKLNLEIEALTDQINEEKLQLSELGVEKFRLEKVLDTCMAEYDKVANIYKDKLEEYEIQKELNNKMNNEIETLEISLKKFQNEVNAFTLQFKQLEIDEKNKVIELKLVQDKFDDLDKKLPDDQKQMVAGIDYSNFKPGKIL